MNMPSVEHAHGPSFTPVPGIPYWTQAMERATQAQRVGQMPQALFHYRLAISAAQKWLLAAGSPTPDECLRAFVSSHFCLADLQAQDDHSGGAATCLADVHQVLLGIIARQDRSCAWHQAAVWYSRDTHGALLAHLTHHGHHPAIEQALHSGCMVLCAAAPQVH